MESGDEGRNWEQFEAWGRAMAPLVEQLYARVRDEGPLAVADLRTPRRKTGSGGGWSSGSEAKTALEYLFWKGRLSATRRPDFSRVYDLTERVIPLEALNAPAPPREDAERELVLRAAAALGVATIEDLADYFALHKRRVGMRVAELVEQGRLIPAEVEGWDKGAVVASGASATPPPAGVSALVSPFDSLVFNRARAQRLFGFRYRLEIYVPAARREFGYYVLPFLLGDRLVARVDLKADRKTSTLVVKGPWLEEHAPPETLDALDRELKLLAGWLELGEIVNVDDPGGSPRLVEGIEQRGRQPRLF